MDEKNRFQGITLLGLGPGDAGYITREAWNWLERIPEIYLRTRHHPAVANLPTSISIHSFDEMVDFEGSCEAVKDNIVHRVLELGKMPGGVTYAVPGHPMVAEITAPEIYKRAGEMGIPVQIFHGLSILEPAFFLLGIDPFENLIILDALEIARNHHPKFPPSLPVIISHISSRQAASDVKQTLMAVYPEDYPLKCVINPGVGQACVVDVRLGELDRKLPAGLVNLLYIPPLNENISFEKFQDVIARLRAPDGCPWDREQTHRSLRNNLLEETYEALHALDSNSPQDLMEELGDLLLQIVLHAQIASEEGEFKMGDVIHNINEKIIRRHPHVFSTEEVTEVTGVLQNWEELKQQERNLKNHGNFRGMLTGVPVHFPSLAQAQELQARAARVGFDWENVADVWSKVAEELEELRQADTLKQRENEFGDLLFAIVNLIRWFKLDAESVLRQTNARFRRRFEYIEQSAARSGKQLKDMSLREMDSLWDEAKRLEHQKDTPQDVI